MTLPALEDRILYIDSHYLIVNKLPGEAAEGAGPGMVDLPGGLTGRYGPLTALHRLDVPVSGCLLLARTPEARSRGASLFSQGKVNKIYWAVIEGLDAAIPPEGELVHWLYHDHRRNKSVAYGEPGPDRRKGTLRCRFRGRGERYTFLEIELLTGRSHQIRAQLAALGLHIKGDLKYGSRRSEKGGGIRLHARSLSFQDPLSGELIRAEAAPPCRDSLWEAWETSVTRNLPCP